LASPAARRKLSPLPRRLGIAVALAALACAVGASAATAAGKVRTWTIHYRGHDAVQHTAYVLLPAWYGPKDNPPLPLIISPHGRGLSGRSNARLWGSLPADGWFAVVNPDGLSRYTWGAAGQIEDLARMPELLERTLPWLHVDRGRIYAFGGSMGGQETLLLLARYPRLLAGAAAFDSVADFALQYRSFRSLTCKGRCLRAWKGPVGVGLQSLARQLIGGTPAQVPRAYAARSPITYARSIASSCVPLQLWWSAADKVVRDQRQQSGRLFETIRRLNPDAPVQAFTGLWIHSDEMRARTRLPLALARFGLLPPTFDAPTRALHIVPAPPGSSLCTRPTTR
jgi:pimeloyl-ACP methyl ester carboxylesterase